MHISSPVSPDELTLVTIFLHCSTLTCVVLLISYIVAETWKLIMPLVIIAFTALGGITKMTVKLVTSGHMGEWHVLFRSLLLH